MIAKHSPHCDSRHKDSEPCNRALPEDIERRNAKLPRTVCADCGTPQDPYHERCVKCSGTRWTKAPVK